MAIFFRGDKICRATQPGLPSAQAAADQNRHPGVDASETMEPAQDNRVGVMQAVWTAESVKDLFAENQLTNSGA